MIATAWNNIKIKYAVKKIAIGQKEVSIRNEKENRRNRMASKGAASHLTVRGCGQNKSADQARRVGVSSSPPP